MSRRGFFELPVIIATGVAGVVRWLANADACGFEGGERRLVRAAPQLNLVGIVDGGRMQHAPGGHWLWACTGIDRIGHGRSSTFTPVLTKLVRLRSLSKPNPGQMPLERAYVI